MTIPNMFPEPISGYEILDAEFGVIVPTGTDAINLVNNPSLETDTTGWAPIAGAIARTALNAAFGIYSLQCTPIVGINDGCYYDHIHLINGIQYFFSFYFAEGNQGESYKAYFANLAGIQQGPAIVFTAKSYIQRIVVSWSCDSTSPFRIYVTKNAHTGITPFYIDGIQVESGYLTTYIDGDQKGFLSDREDYYWNGTAHSSSSTRIAQSRHGGEEKKLRDLGFNLLAVIGLGLGGFANRFNSLSAGGEIYDGTYKTGRNFALVGAVTGEDWEDLSADKLSGLYSIFSPDFVSPPQPIFLTYLNKQRDDKSLKTFIPCVFDGGLDDEINNYNQQRLSLNFHAYLPWVAQSETEVGYGLDYNFSIPNTGTMLLRRSNGRWIATDYGDGLCWSSVEFQGYIYISRLSAAGVSSLDRVDPETGIHTLIAAAGAATNIYSLAVYGNYLYLGGSFITLGGVAYARIARFDGTNFAALGAGIPNGEIDALAFSEDGRLYIGGTFTHPAGNDCACYWDGAYNAMNTGIESAGGHFVKTIAVGHDGKMWFGGYFDTIVAGAVHVHNVTYWNTITGTFVDILGIGNAAEQIYNITIDFDGTIYAQGDFINSESAHALMYIAYWDGYDWQTLNGGYITSQTNKVGRNKEGIFFGSYRLGVLSPIAEFPAMSVLWNRSVFVPFDYEEDAGGETVYTFYVNDKNYCVVVGLQMFSYINPHNALTANVTIVANPGNFNSFPMARFTGPGVLRSLKNFSTGKFIWFYLILQVGEIAELSLDPLNFHFKSNLRDNLLSEILPGSNLSDFFLKPGDNDISLFISGPVDGNTNASLKFTPVYGSLP